MEQTIQIKRTKEQIEVRLLSENEVETLLHLTSYEAARLSRLLWLTASGKVGDEYAMG